MVSDKYTKELPIIGEFVNLQNGYDDGEQYVIFRVDGNEIAFSDQNNLYEEVVEVPQKTTK